MRCWGREERTRRGTETQKEVSKVWETEVHSCTSWPSSMPTIQGFAKSGWVQLVYMAENIGFAVRLELEPLLLSVNHKTLSELFNFSEPTNLNGSGIYLLRVFQGFNDPK